MIHIDPWLPGLPDSGAPHEPWPEKDIWTDFEFACLLLDDEMSRDTMLVIALGYGLNDKDRERLAILKAAVSTNLDYIRRAIIARLLTATKIEPEPTKLLFSHYYLQPIECVRWWRTFDKVGMYESGTFDSVAKAVEARSAIKKKEGAATSARPSTAHKAACIAYAIGEWERERREGKKPLTFATHMVKRKVMKTECCEGTNYTERRMALWISPHKPKI